jgi:hypothetical protein
MAGGNNRSFLRNPQEFIRTHHILANPQGLEDVTKLHNGVYNIDLVTIGDVVNPVASTAHVRLENYDKNGPHRPESRPVPAFFIEAKRNQSSEFTLDSRCDYMFTADLSGCLFAAYDGPKANTLTVEHLNENDEEARVHAEDFVNNIIHQNYHFYRILFPSTKFINESQYVKVYRAASCVVGVREGGVWHFYYKPWKDMVAEL